MDCNQNVAFFFLEVIMGKINYFIQQKNEKEQQVASQMLFSLVDYLESEECRRKPLLAYFEEIYTGECGHCDNCKSEKKEEIDVTIFSQKALSTIKRSDERFGANHIVDILRGANTQKVRAFRHENLKTYGIGKDQTKEFWIHLINKLVQKKYVKKDLKFGALSLK